MGLNDRNLKVEYHNIEKWNSLERKTLKNTVSLCEGWERQDTDVDYS